jgi:arsenite methyltransferase
MKNSEEIKQVVREKYSEIAQQSKTQNASSCCGVGGCNTVDYTIFSDDYSQLAGYHEGADLGLGCGLPTEFAQIKTNDTVVDLGSGAGNDCFVARSLTGPAGTVIGIDMTQAMIVKARENASKLGFDNVQFRLGDIEDLPLQNNIADVVVSNCVMNLVPDKSKAFAETYRILKPGGHFSISDVVLEGALPLGLQQAAEMYAGCVSGALQKTNYLDIIQQAGFTNISIQKTKISRNS